ncbi:MAG: hypothetical protein Kilf2KO_15140 [Rhodospirillales bacterium]
MGRGTTPDAAVALAALSICESLIIALVEKGLLDPSELEEIVESARSSHLKAQPTDFSSGEHRQAAEILRRILANSNSIRGTAHL